MTFKAGLTAFTAIVALAACSSAPGYDPASPVARLDTRAAQGTADGGLLVFRGIPYAAPPVDNLR